MNKAVLIILDGFGHSENKENNAIYKAKKPFIDSLYKNYPHSLIETSGEAVGLPAGVMGNSEVGHLTIGSGRIVYQDLTRIHKFIKQEGFESLEKLNLFSNSVESIHLMGLLSDGGVHSHEEHLHALIEYFKNHQSHKKVYIHVITDGRDTPPNSGESYIKKLEDKIKDSSNIIIATVVGRFYAMDRDKRWDRLEIAYKALTEDKAKAFTNAVDAIQDAYKNNEGDEFVLPRLIEGGKRITNNDGVLFFNFRADRAREITMALTENDFKHFSCPVKVKEENYLCFTSYSEDFNLPVLFPKQSLQNGLGEIVSNLNLKQFRIAETEKYAHVTYFLNGGNEKVLAGEDRKLIESPRDVKTYDEKPEMSAREVTEALVSAIDRNEYSLLVCNYANGDMVGHTGVESAAIKAIECLDECLEKVVEASLKNNYEVLITADHGNCEEMYDHSSGQAMTQHSTNPVPLIWVGKKAKGKSLSNGGLSDIAPTILDIMEIERPKEMTGRPL